jgi:AraC-like DNA-binding protein
VWAVLVDTPSLSLSGGRSGEKALAALRAAYPRLGLVLLAGVRDPLSLFRLGKLDVPNLVLLTVDRLDVQLPRSLAQACQDGVPAQVAAALSLAVPHRELRAVRLALESVHRRLSADEFAAEVGLSRPFLSERLKRVGLPSTGHLLVWSRLLHAGAWLAEPGRTGQSVARQLDYSSGAALRRALRNYTGATPTEVIDQGGLTFLLRRFLERHDLPLAGNVRRHFVA